METPISSILARKGDSIFSVGPQASVSQAVHLMNQMNIGAVAVMEGERLLGIFTERDVLRRVIDGRMDPDATPVRKVMTKQLAYVRPDSLLGEAMAVMSAKNCRHLPVMEDDRLLGVISSRDLIEAALDGREHEISELMQYISGSFGPDAVPVGHGRSI